MKKNTFGYSLLELSVVTVIVGVTSAVAMSTVWQSIPTIEAKEGLRTVEQTLLLAKSTAIRLSQTIIVDLSQAKSNHNNNGGIIEIKNTAGTVINTYYLNKNVLIDNSSTTGNYVLFDFRGQPVGSSGNTSAITSSNNTLVVTYNKGNGSLALKQLEISPVTGNIEQKN
jgi:prepilin-type N-terminal cleavage/methylation domain-containing protein